LGSKLNDLNNISSQISNFDPFFKRALREHLLLDEIEGELSSLQQRNATAISDDDYVSIMEMLFLLEIPERVFKNEVANSIRFYPNKDRINLDILKSIAGGDFDSETREEYIQSILSWHIENINIGINSEEYSVDYGSYSEDALKFFEVKIDANPLREESYFIMSQLDDLMFDKDYKERKVEDHIYIELDNNEKIIRFSTTENILFTELPIFVSPAISQLPITNIKVSEKIDKFSRRSLIILSLILAFFIGLIAYIATQMWYKRKYEDYLFKNKNNLYNIVSYIKSAKEKNLNSKEIESKLKKSGWSSEQINYVMKKYVGERTGLFEIPIEKILNIFKKNKNQKDSNIKFEEPPKWR